MNVVQEITEGAGQSCRHTAVVPEEDEASDPDEITAVVLDVLCREELADCAALPAVRLHSLCSLQRLQVIRLRQDSQRDFLRRDAFKFDFPFQGKG